MTTKELFTNGQALSLVAHQSFSYVPRTEENAKSADVTVAIAVDFNTAGERLTRRAAEPRYVAVPYGIDVATAAEILSSFMREHSARTLNVAGNGIYTFAEKGISQAEVNQWVFLMLRAAHAKHSITAIRSGGQTGMDQAGLVAAIAAGIPALGLYPKNFRRRNEKGIEIYSTVPKLTAELEAQASMIRRSERRYHRDRTLPQQGEILVFGSNLAGRHGAGAAKLALMHFGAIYGQPRYLQGSSYAVPTKDGRPGTPDLKDPAATLSVEEIKGYVDEFLEYARSHPDVIFFVTRLGCSLAVHLDKDIAPLFQSAPLNCDLPEEWAPWILEAATEVYTAEPINIFSGSQGIGGALTNMSERAREKGKIKHSYPVLINDVRYPDSEAAYQALKIPGNVEYNDGLMIDIISLKFIQNRKLLDLVTRNGGVSWLKKCSHFTNAVSTRFQAWEGQGMDSRFIRDLVFGYNKAITGRGPVTRVVHVSHAPYDVYAGRDMVAQNPKYKDEGYGNPYPLSVSGSRAKSLSMFSDLLRKDKDLMARARKLKGKTIGCWCKSPDAYETECHGDILAAAAEGRVWEPVKAVQPDLFDM